MYFKIFFALLLLTSIKAYNQQATASDTAGKLTKLKIIRNLTSPDSNVLFITYDNNGYLKLIHEYKIVPFIGWKVVSGMNYMWNKNNNLNNITFWNTEESNNSKDILSGFNNNGSWAVNPTTELSFYYDKQNKLQSTVWSSNPGYYSSYDLNEQGQIVANTFINKSTKKALNKWVYQYDKLGRQQTRKYYQYESNVLKLYQDSTVKYDNHPSYSNDFMLKNSNCPIINPFNSLPIAYLNNAVLANCTYSYNLSGYPETLTIQAGNKSTTYLFEYVMDNEDYTWLGYLVNTGTDFKYKHSAFIQPDSIAAKAVAAYSRLPKPKKIYQLSTNQIIDADIAISKGAANSTKYIQVKAHSKSAFSVENYSRYYLAVKISGYQNVALPPRSGAFYPKEYVTDTTQMHLEYPDSFYVLKRNQLQTMIKSYGGYVKTLDTLSNRIVNGFLNMKEPLSFPIIRWEQQGSKDVMIEDHDELRDELTTVWLKGIAVGLNGYYTDERSKNRQELENQYKENELVYDASLGYQNYYSFHFLFPEFQKAINTKSSK